MSRRSSELFHRWLSGDVDLLDNILDSDERPDETRAERKSKEHRLLEKAGSLAATRSMKARETRDYYVLYAVVAVISCLFFIFALLFTVSRLPPYGTELPQAAEVSRRYVEDGLEETGAVNIISGIILDYRAFDTLGESHVLFTALICVILLLRRDSRNMRPEYEDYYTIRSDRFHDLSREALMRGVGRLMVPCILLFGIYILLNGQLSPGGGFSGGAVMGAGLIIFASAFGFSAADRLISDRRFHWIAFLSLSFYSFAKGYVFFTGANSLENHIPKGIPGAILSGGLILPLDIAVGLVVGCTMYGFFSLFKRGNIGHD